MSESLSSSRIDYMDSARSILMILGVVLHSANVYNYQGTWIVSDADQHLFFNMVSEGIHFFRMPAFFVISGFFCAMILGRYDVLSFLKKRIVRVVVPLISTAVLLNLPQTLLTNYVGVTDFNIDSVDFFQQGEWNYHLWFLINVVIYYLFFTAIYPLLGKTYKLFLNLNVFNNQKPIDQSVIALIAIGAMMLIYMLLVFSAYIVPGLYDKVPFIGSPFFILYYFLFFAFGFVLKDWALLRESFINKGFIAWVVVAALYLLKMALGQEQASYLNRAVDYALLMAATMGSIHLTLYFFQKLFDRPSSTWQYLSEASYTIYLFHHSIVIIFGIALVELELPLAIKFVLLCTVSFLIPLIIHEWVVRRIRLFRFLFNGR